jgi:hypothetical protein
MKEYTITWTEVQLWKTSVEAKNKKEALKKLYEDEAQENAEMIKTLSEFEDIELEEVGQ